MATNITFHAGTVDSEERTQLLGQKGITIWLTGLSASGKVRQWTTTNLSLSDNFPYYDLYINNKY